MLFGTEDCSIIDIGGSRLNATFGNSLPLAFKGKADFPKEIAYTAGMEKWVGIAATSYQTTDELYIIERTAHHVVSELPNNTKIIDLGAADSSKYEPYVRAVLAQGKTCTYVALDIARDSLVQQVRRAKNKFPTIACVGLWGSFEDGDRFFKEVPAGRLFLSLGSIFFNAPDGMCRDRCDEFRRHLGPGDRLVVGQDGPSGAQGKMSHASYQTAAYDAFFTRYLKGIQQLAGITADAKTAWSVESRMDSSMHFFEVTAKHNMTCTNFDSYIVKPGTSYRMFPSWKRGEEEIHNIATKQGLAIRTLGKAEKSGMRQYMIRGKGLF